MKQFTVVFPLARVGEKIYILLGEQPKNKPLSGYLNGYGGKVEEGDTSILHGAARELREELGIDLECPVYIGNIEHAQKQVFFYLSQTDKVIFQDTSEMINNQWFDLEVDSFVSRMLPGDIEIIKHIQENSKKYFDKQVLTEFKIVKEGSAISEAVTALDKSLLPKIN